MFKLLIVVAFVAIIISLFSGGFFLVKDQGESKRTVKSLTWRIGLSVALFLLLILGYFMGWLHPHAVAPPGN